MRRSKLMAAALAGTAVLCCVLSPTASAAGPLLLAPWALVHLLRAAVAAVTVAATAAPVPGYYGSGDQGPSGYAPPSAYGPAPVYYPPLRYAAPPPTYYRAPTQTYYPAPRYYGQSAAYGRPVARVYQPPRAYYYAGPRVRYAGRYGAQNWRGSPRFYRR